MTILHGDCREQLATLPDCSVDAIVTDPPYELGFMGKKWDASGIAYDPTVWAECLRVLKPGGHLLAFGGTRTYHRMTVAIEDAGFEIRDSLHWLYGSGFPKSHNLKGEFGGWGTALKPAHEPIVLARKPLVGTVAANVMAYGTGALNIDATRVAAPDGVPVFIQKGGPSQHAYGDGLNGSQSTGAMDTTTGRWPANLILTHSPDCHTECVSECPVAALNTQSGTTKSTARTGPPGGSTFGGGAMNADTGTWYGDSGGASRFFTTTEWDPQIDVPFLYVAKPSRRERNAGLDGTNGHPTVKPVALMRHLVRLVTPPGGTVLDPFLGSGTTAVAATLEGFAWIGCELTDDYLPIIEARVAWAEQNRPEPELTLFTEQP